MDLDSRHGDVPSTLADVSGLRKHRERKSRYLMIAGHIILVVVFVAAIVGAFDTRTQTLTASSGVDRVTVEAPWLTRSAPAAPLTLILRSTDIIDEPITVELCADYFDRFDFQNWYPNPSSEVRSGEKLTYTFDPPETKKFVVALDARTAPDSGISPSTCQLNVSTSRTTSQESLSVSFTTWRFP